MKRAKTRNIIWFKRNRCGNPEQGTWAVYLVKTFSHVKYGTKEKALEEATKFRDKFYKLIYREFQENYICENVNYREYHHKNGKIYRYYRSVYFDAVGNRKEKSFNIDKLGEEEALKKAKALAMPGKRWDLVKTYIKEDKND